MTTSKKKNKSKLADIVDTVYSLMVKEDLDELTWEEDEGCHLKIKRQGSSSVPVHDLINHQKIIRKKDVEKEEEIDTSLYIRSPMNGVFYSAPSPGSPPFVKKNSQVNVGETVCIIEAMKLMNEVQVEHNCKILEIMVETGMPVKVGQALFKIENQ
ncbi:MAG: biotin/lipoyl-containing protein [Elusimicrobiota bacterium]